MDEKKTKKSNPDTPAAPKKNAQGDVIFALDIGTRTVVGVLAERTPQGCRVIDMVTAVHESRSMADGQIEDIQSVSRDIRRVKRELEARQKISLKNACIAAAGRALKTLRASWEYKLPKDKIITPEALKATELDAVRRTCESFTKENDNASFYCVGHSVISRSLDGFKVQKPEGHRGERLTTDIIGAFLPAYVVESLCTAVNNAGLEVSRLTLEPIAAMSAVIPPELRLINIALCDIGAGTSDVAVSRDGSVVAYGMATTAGDEITETIMKELLVDFNTAELLKTSTEKEISYKNILLMDCKATHEQIMKLIAPTARELAKVIASEIISANAKPPQAVFLVGGGSKLEGLAELVAEELNVDKSRIVSGRRELLRGIIAPEGMTLGAEHTTPLGIAISSGEGVSYDFTTITVNGRKLRALDTARLTVFELLGFAKIKPEEMMAPAGKTINITVSGEKITLRGEPATPSEITVNGEPASLNTVVTKGDEVVITPAQKGADGTARLSDYFDLSAIRSCTVTLLGKKRRAGRYIQINGREIVAERRIWDGDTVELVETETLGQLLEVNGITEPILLNDKKVSPEVILQSGDIISLENAPKAIEEKPGIPAEIPEKKLEEPKPAAPKPEAPKSAGVRITMNGIEAEFPAREDGTPPIFLDVAATFSDNPTELLTSAATVTVNGKIARLDEEIHDGDVIVIE
ncbi:MAG: pilus assembly protein PilM [Oscillospiraceae bacterium]|nr:pilus assembly protein PilM [Oscillospiraceae bacterium]